MDNLGICANCLMVGNCSFRSSNSKPVWYCNDFRHSEHSTLIDKNNSVKENISNNKIFSAEEYSGLCAYCELRVNCLIPRKSGGVWHCNEYI
jgi:hypothetical protein